MFLSTKELAAKWGINQSRVLKLARDGRIEGAVLFGNNWLYPVDVKKPADARIKVKNPAVSYFRFPHYIDFEEDTYSPSLSEDEKALRQAQLLFYCCEFEKADKILFPLIKNTKSKYIRITALFYGLYISMFESTEDFDSIWLKFNMELTEEFPYKNEMMLLKYSFEAFYGLYNSLLEDFEINPDYSYHPSAYYLLMNLSFLAMTNKNFSLLTQLRFDSYELLCQQMEHEGYFMEAQQLHFLLMMAYQWQNNEDKMNYHIKRGIEIGFEKKLYFCIASYLCYYPKEIDKILKDFPKDFYTNMSSLGKIIHKKISRFSGFRESVSFFGVLSSSEFVYAFYATQGKANKEIAKELKVSEKYVSSKYSSIYQKLNIKNKKELIALINETFINNKFI